MKIRVTDILKEGCSAEFVLERSAVNRRLAGTGFEAGPGRKGEEASEFSNNPEAALELSLEGKTVHLHGRVTGELRSPCARCAERAVLTLDVPVEMTLKPEGERSRDESEDVDFGYYAGEEVDCGAIAEEALMLAIPFVVVCSESCKGLCPMCGGNRNLAPCECARSEAPNSPFGALKDLKILQ